MAAVKLESENNEYQRARSLLSKARESAGTARVVMKSAKLEWALANLDEANQLILEGLERFSDNSKLWMMQGQIREQEGENAAAVAAYMEGLKRCPQCVPLWLLSSRAQMSTGEYTRAR